MASLIKELRTIVDKDDDHICTDMFEKLPSKKLYPDYFVLISNPIAIDTIMKKAKKKGYQSLDEVKEDLETMYTNAKFYNEKGSWVYNDADSLKSFSDKWFKTNQ